ncbi:MAG TPA: ABC transporter permease [Opitutaceae bacterium]|nr:ABC transporter permease [Opitutaceae bacterium]
MTSAAPRLSPAEEPLEKGSSLWHDAWLRLRKNKLAVFSMWALGVIGLLCAIGPWALNLAYETQGLDVGATPPLTPVVKVFRVRSSERAMPYENVPLNALATYEGIQSSPDANSVIDRISRGEKVRVREFVFQKSILLMGSDTAGRDLFARMLYGGRVSLAVGLCATFVALTIGIVYGAVAGFFGSKRDAFMMRAVDIMYSLPFAIFVILLMVFFGRNIVLLFVAIGAVEWLTMARIVRSQVMAVKKMEFIEAARSLGFGRRRIIFRHIIPNILGPIIVYTTLTIPSVMLLEAFLSFLGLGVQPPMSSWGVLIKDGAEKMEEFPWLLIFPGTIFSLTLFSLNFLGDGLRDALDVRSSKD